MSGVDAELAELRDRLSALESRVSEAEEIRRDVSLASEALTRIKSVLEELVDASAFDNEEFEDDLDRIDQIAHLLI